MVQALKVLVVDDEPTVTKSCRRILRQEGYEVDTTESGRVGLARASEQDFDLVMADLRMPDLDGMDLVRTVRRQRPQTAVIVITGYGSVPSAVESTKLGVSAYIEKPFTPQEIKEAAGEALATAAGQREVRIEADLVRHVLRRASSDQDFGRDLLTQGGSALAGFALGTEAKAAIASGDIARIETWCGELSENERDWLDRRLQCEAW